MQRVVSLEAKTAESLFFLEEIPCADIGRRQHLQGRKGVLTRNKKSTRKLTLDY